MRQEFTPPLVVVKGVGYNFYIKTPKSAFVLKSQLITGRMVPGFMLEFMWHLMNVLQKPEGKETMELGFSSETVK